MTRFGPIIEPITSTTPGECANYYATGYGFHLRLSAILQPKVKFSRPLMITDRQTFQMSYRIITKNSRRSVITIFYNQIFL